MTPDSRERTTRGGQDHSLVHRREPQLQLMGGDLCFRLPGGALRSRFTGWDHNSRFTGVNDSPRLTAGAHNFGSQ